MKTAALLLTLLLAGCHTAPKNLFVKPEMYSSDLIIPTVWDGNHPIAYFEHELLVGATYYDYRGVEYKLVETDVPNVFALRVQVVK